MTGTACADCGHMRGEHGRTVRRKAGALTWEAWVWDSCKHKGCECESFEEEVVADDPVHD